MVKSIKHFEEKSIMIFEKLEDEFFKNPQHITEYVHSITEELHKLGLLMLEESLENMNQLLKESGMRKSSWVVEKDSRKLPGANGTSWPAHITSAVCVTGRIMGSSGMKYTNNILLDLYEKTYRQPGITIEELKENARKKCEEKGMAGGIKILKSSYGVLQDDFFNSMRAAGYTDVESGERGSTEEHLTVTQFKVQAEQQHLETVTIRADQAEQALADTQSSVEKQGKKLKALQRETKAVKMTAVTIQEIESMGKKAIFGSNIILTPDEYDIIKRYATNGIFTNAENRRLKEKVESDIMRHLTAVWIL